MDREMERVQEKTDIERESFGFGVAKQRLSRPLEHLVLRQSGPIN